jgi:hypothetical protein
MVDSELVAAYRLNAASCTEVARHFEDVEHKIALLEPVIMPSGSGQS